MKQRVLNVRTKLFLAFVLISAVVGILIGFQSFSGARKIITYNIEDKLVSLRNIKKIQLNATIAKISSQFYYYAVNDEIIAAAVNFNAAVSAVKSDNNMQYLKDCEHLVNRYYNTVFEPSLRPELKGGNYQVTSPESILLQCSRISKHEKVRTQVNTVLYDKYVDKYDQFIDYYRQWQGLVDVFILNADGMVIYSHNQDIELGVYVSEGDWAETMLSKAYNSARIASTHTEMARIFDYTFFPTHPEFPVTFLATPIYDDDEFVGVLAGAMSPSQFDVLMTNNNDWAADGLGKTGESYIVGKDGLMRSKSRLLIQDKQEYLKEMLREGKPEEFVNSIDKMGSTILLQKAYDGIVQKIFAGIDGVALGKDYLGEETITAYAPLEIPFLDWGIIVEINKVEADEPIADLMHKIQYSTIAIVALVILITLYISEIITRPIYKLSDVVLRFADGHYNLRLNDSSKDEIGELSRAFDNMAQTITLRNTEVVTANKSLTAEIEERITTEKELKKEKSFISSVLDSQMFILMITDNANNILRTNKMFESITDSSLSEVKGTGDTVFGEHYNEFATEVFRCNVPSSFSGELYSKTGEVHAVSWVVSIMDAESVEGGKVLIWTGIDVTEQKKVEAKLIYNAKMLQALTGNAQEAIFITNGNKEIILWNESAEKIFGYNASEVKKINIGVLFSTDVNSYLPAVKGGSKEIHGVTVEIEGVSKTGKKFSAELSISEMIVQGDLNTMYIVRDVTVRKQKEAELTQALDKAKIAEKAKTDFLANMSHEIRTPLNGILGFLDLLSQTELDTTQGDYLRIISNSADSLLSIINEILDFSKIESGKMVLERVEFNVYEELEHIADLFVAKVNEKSQDLLLDIDTRISPALIGDPLRLRQIISNLLSNSIKFTPNGGCITISSMLLSSNGNTCAVRFTIIDNGIGISKEKQASIFDAFSQADNSVTRKYGGSGLGLTICSRLATLMGSKLELESIDGNGTKFWFDVTFQTGSGSGNIPSFKGLKVAYIKGNLLHEGILLKYLKALGCDLVGIDSYTDISKIVDLSVVFVDYSNTSIDDIRMISRLVPGSARVVIAKDDDRNVIKEISSMITKTLFKPISFMRIVNTLSEITFGSKTPQVAIESNIRFKGKALVAEDNPVNQRLIKILLNKLGITIDMAEDGQKAFDFITSHEYDIVFMDIHMPVMDGITVTKNYIEWTKLNGKEPTVIVALTANVIEEDQKLYFEAGMKEFLAKPVIVPELVSILLKYLPKDERSGVLSGELKRLSKELGIDDLTFLGNIMKEFIALTRVQVSEMYGFALSENITALLEHSASINSAALSLKQDNMVSILRRFDSYCKGGDMIMSQQLLDEINMEIDRLAKVFQS